jgi:hypothetical protein
MKSILYTVPEWHKVFWNDFTIERKQRLQMNINYVKHLPGFIHMEIIYGGSLNDELFRVWHMPT